MVNGPKRLILINAGRYDYADVELRGSLQIVGPNNTGKTTLINTLQFLYLDDRRYMEFGSYTPEQTREYYFPNQYSYVLFEVLGVFGKCVIGWRGQSRVIGGEPERFLFEGPFDQDDFVRADHQVREPKEVNARLSLKNYRVLKTPQEHRELLLLSTKGESKGLGLVALRDNDRYPQFRETLKSLLCLSTISQDQMRRQLLMLAGLASDRHALNVKELFGDDYDHILNRKQGLARFKKQEKQIELLVQTSARREVLRGQVAQRWIDLLAKRQRFEQEHNTRMKKLTKATEEAAQLSRDVEGLIEKCHNSKEAFAETKGALSLKLAELSEHEREFTGFQEDWARVAVRNLQRDVRELESLIQDAETESRQKIASRHQRCLEIVERARETIAHFDHALITLLRSDLTGTELSSLSNLFNFDILEQTVGDGGVILHSRARLVRFLRFVAKRIHDDIYKDANISLPLPAAKRSVSELQSVVDLRERLTEEEAALAKLEATLVAIDQRDDFVAKLDVKRSELDGKRDKEGREVSEGLAKQLFRFEQYQKDKQQESKLKEELKQILNGIVVQDNELQELHKAAKKASADHSSSTSEMETEKKSFADEIRIFSKCSAPQLSNPSVGSETAFPDDFPTCVEQYLKLKEELDEIDSEIVAALQRLEVALGGDYAGSDEAETIQRFREELEALPEREDVLRRDWEHQLTGLQATFDEILRGVGDIKSAADRLNRELSRIQLSNLASLNMEVREQTDLIGSMRRLASIAQPGLFEDSSGLEASIAAFRRKFEATPLLHYQDLFTLEFIVTGDDGKRHHYNDFRQVESDGTTITIKVLFNLLVLKSLLREDSQKGLLCEIPFFLDELHSLDAVNRHAILATARTLGFIAITAAPESASEVDALYFLQPQRGRIVLRNSHRFGILSRKIGA